MPLTTKALSEPAETADGTRILIARYRPRGLPRGAESWDRWEKRLAPSAELVAAYTGKRRERGRVVARGLPPLEWGEIRSRFLAEMRGEPARAALEELAAELDRGETLTLLCYCKDASHCHRTLVAGLLQKRTARDGSRKRRRSP